MKTNCSKLNSWTNVSMDCFVLVVKSNTSVEEMLNQCFYQISSSSFRAFLFASFLLLKSTQLYSYSL